MKKEQALKQLGKYDAIGRKVLSIYEDEVPDEVVRGLKEEHERSMKPNPRFILGDEKLIKIFENI